jgi:signal transduction histidine kinase
MESIYQDVHLLGRLTQTLLEFARASGDPNGLEIDLVRIDEILLALPGEIAKLNKFYAVELKFDQLPEEDEKLLVFGNEALLLTAIRNIVINACKYSDNHKAKVRLHFYDNVITIFVEDEGKGIPSSELDNIFQPFYRVDDKNPNQGFGLGLSLAHQIIKLHKGYILVKSVIDNGTIFSIVLPPAGSLLNKE